MCACSQPGAVGHDAAIERGRAPWLLLAPVALGCVAVVLAVPLGVVAQRGQTGATVGDVGEWFVVFFAPGFLVSGWWLVRRRPALVLGWLFVAAGTTAALAGLAAAYAGVALERGWPGAAWALWVFSWIWQPQSTLIGIAMLLFPDAVDRGRWQRRLVWLLGATSAVSMLVSVLQPGNVITTPDHPNGSHPGVVNPIGVAGLHGLFHALTFPLALVGGITGLIPMIVTAVFWRRSVGLRRRQFRWATLIQASALLIYPALFAAPTFAGPFALVQTVATQALIVVAILQWQAFDIDVVIRRSVLSAALLVAGLGSYAAVVAIIALVLGHTGTVPSTIGAAVAIFAFGPLSVRIRSVVNRLFYGRRDDPYAVVAELGRHLAGAADPSDALRSIVTTMTEQLKLPYAAIVGMNGQPLAMSGRPEADDVPLQVELSHQGESVGTLIIGHRRGTATMAPGEEVLLQTVGHQVGAAVRAHELVDGLRVARERVVVTREEERRRIQRDLHDGLGPQLTAVTLKLAAAHNHLAAEHASDADSLLLSASEDLRRAVSDVRHLVYSLGDPAIGALGLEAALNDQINQLTRAAGLSTTLDIGELPELSAATEEAMHRIITEAVTNVVRHASASRCVVRICGNGTHLEADVIDDGRGLGDHVRRGVGTRSMEARAEELGGGLSVVNHESGGTHVHIRLPLASR